MEGVGEVMEAAESGKPPERQATLSFKREAPQDHGQRVQRP